MRRRIFIAINLPEDIKNEIAKMQQEFSHLPVRFTKKESIHLTLFFIGYVTDEEMLEMCREAHEITKKHEPFVIKFNRLCFGPSFASAQGGSASGGKASEGKPPGRPPRLIWLEGERSEELFNLKIDIDNSLMVRDKDPRFFAEAEKKTKMFLPHITIARIRQMDWKKLPEKPIIDQEINISVPVNSIEVMESQLKRDGAEYAILESAEFSK